MHLTRILVVALMLPCTQALGNDAKGSAAITITKVANVDIKAGFAALTSVNAPASTTVDLCLQTLEGSAPFGVDVLQENLGSATRDQPTTFSDYHAEADNRCENRNGVSLTGDVPDNLSLLFLVRPE